MRARPSPRVLRMAVGFFLGGALCCAALQHQLRPAPAPAAAAALSAPLPPRPGVPPPSGRPLSPAQPAAAPSAQPIRSIALAQDELIVVRSLGLKDPFAEDRNGENDAR